MTFFLQAVLLVLTTVLISNVTGATRVTDILNKKLGVELLHSGSKVNKVVSPLLVRLSLFKLMSAAKYAARTELLSALGFINEKQLMTAYDKIEPTLKEISHRDSILLNVIYVEASKINRNFLNKTKDFFVRVENIGFQLTNTALAFINRVISAQSYQRITNIVEQGDFDKNTNMMIVNAVQFKTMWEYCFPTAATIVRHFNTLNGTVNMPMMNKIGEVFYLNDDELEVQALEMSLKFTGMYFMVILPNKQQDLQRILKKFSEEPDLMKELRSKMKWTFTKISIPRFKIKTTVTWNEALQNLGVKEIFNPETKNLSSILKNPDTDSMFVGKIKQKVFLQVEEDCPGFGDKPDSTSAYSGYAQFTEFSADRPFYFVISIMVQNDENRYYNEMFNGVYYGPE